MPSDPVDLHLERPIETEQYPIPNDGTAIVGIPSVSTFYPHDASRDFVFYNVEQFARAVGRADPELRAPIFVSQHDAVAVLQPDHPRSEIFRLELRMHHALKALVDVAAMGRWREGKSIDQLTIVRFCKYYGALIDGGEALLGQFRSIAFQDLSKMERRIDQNGMVELSSAEQGQTSSVKLPPWFTYECPFYMNAANQHRFIVNIEMTQSYAFELYVPNWDEHLLDAAEYVAIKISDILPDHAVSIGQGNMSQRQAWTPQSS